MKKHVSIVMAMVIAIVLTACTGYDNVTSTNDKSEAVRALVEEDVIPKPSVPDYIGKNNILDDSSKEFTESEPREEEESSESKVKDEENSEETDENTEESSKLEESSKVIPKIEEISEVSMEPSRESKESSKQKESLIVISEVIEETESSISGEVLDEDVSQEYDEITEEESELEEEVYEYYDSSFRKLTLNDVIRILNSDPFPVKFEISEEERNKQDMLLEKCPWVRLTSATELYLSQFLRISVPSGTYFQVIDKDDYYFYVHFYRLGLCKLSRCNVIIMDQGFELKDGMRTLGLHAGAGDGPVPSDFLWERVYYKGIDIEKIKNFESEPVIKTFNDSRIGKTKFGCKGIINESEGYSFIPDNCYVDVYGVTSDSEEKSYFVNFYDMGLICIPIEFIEFTEQIYELDLEDNSIKTFGILDDNGHLHSSDYYYKDVYARVFYPNAFPHPLSDYLG